MQLLDAVLEVAPGAVDLLVDEARRLAQVGHDEARVVARRPAGELHDFGLDHHAARAAPRAGAIAGIEVEVRGLLVERILGAGRHQGGLGVAQQDGVLGHRHDVVEPRLGVEEIEDLRGGKAAVEPNEKACLGKRGPQQREQPTQHTERPIGCLRVAGSQPRRAQILLRLAVEGHEGQQRQVAPAVVVPEHRWNASEIVLTPKGPPLPPSAATRRTCARLSPPQRFRARLRCAR